MRTEHYKYIVKLWQKENILTSIVVNKSYYWEFWAIISWGARLCMLCDSWYFERVYRVCGIVIYKITEKGIDWKEWEELVIVNKSTPKVKKTRAESEAKKQAKYYNIQEITQRIYPTTLWSKLQYLWSEINFLFFTKHNEKST